LYNKNIFPNRDLGHEWQINESKEDKLNQIKVDKLQTPKILEVCKQKIEEKQI
jgi:hypothetical protein